MNVSHNPEQKSNTARYIFNLISIILFPLSKVIRNHPDIRFHFYAYGTQLCLYYFTCNNVAQAFEKLKKKNYCLFKLKLTSGKTELIFESKVQREKLNNFYPVSILGKFPLRNLGMWFDCDLSFFETYSEHLYGLFY